MEGKTIFDKVILLVAVVAIVAAGYFYYQWDLIRKNPEAIAQQEVNALVAKISKLIVLPADETPTVATVSDPEALKDQVFFAKAEKGDKVLIYAQAKKAVLYSVKLNKIIDTAPLNIGDQKAVTPPPAEKTTTQEKKP